MKPCFFPLETTVKGSHMSTPTLSLLGRIKNIRAYHHIFFFTSSEFQMIVSLILYTPVFPSQLTPQSIHPSKHIPAELIALAPDLYSLKRSAWAHGKDVRTLTLTVKCTEFLFF